jgi:hypothetical protein
MSKTVDRTLNAFLRADAAFLDASQVRDRKAAAYVKAVHESPERKAADRALASLNKR